MSEVLANILTNAVSSWGLEMSDEVAVFADDAAAVVAAGAGDLDGAPDALTFNGRAEGGGMWWYELGTNVEPGMNCVCEPG